MVVIIILISGFGFIGNWLINDTFRLRQVEVIGDNLQLEIDAAKVNNLLFVSTTELEKQIYASYALIKSINVIKKYPDKLQLTIERRHGKAIIYAQNGKYLIDEEGVIIMPIEADMDNLPVLIFHLTNVVIGTKVTDTRIFTALRFLAEMKGILPILTISSYDQSSLRVQTEEIDILITQDRPVSETAATLQVLLNRFRMKGNMPTVVDLRFVKPILTY